MGKPTRNLRGMLAGTAGLGVVVAALLIAPSCGDDRAPKRPDVLLVTIDTLRADHLGCYGYRRPTSPNLDAIAAEGVLFESVVAQAPWTMPSLASLLTARHPLELGTVHIYSYLEDGTRTAARIFRERGYTTAAFVSGAYMEPWRGFQLGFDSYHKVPVADRAAGVLEKLLTWLESERSNPLFVWVHLFDPHSDYDAPPPFDTKFGGEIDRRIGTTNYLKHVLNGDAALSPEQLADLRTLYDREIAYVDYEVGRLMRRLRSSDALDRTVVAIGSDHGEGFMEHGRVLHTSTLYEELVRVPLVIRFPAKLPRSRRVPQLVRNLDLLPTLLDLAGLPAEKGSSGVSLLPLIEGRENTERVAFSHTDMTSQELYYSRVPGLNRSIFDTLFMVRRGREKLVRSGKTGRYERYDLMRDPAEKVDLAGPSGVVEGKLRRRLDDWVARYGAGAKSQTPRKLDSLEQERMKELGYVD